MREEHFHLFNFRTFEKTRLLITSRAEDHYTFTYIKDINLPFEGFSPHPYNRRLPNWIEFL